MESTGPLQVGFDLTETGAGAKCPKQRCAMLQRTDTRGMVIGQHGAFTIFKPQDGKMVFELKNLAPFALKIKVYSKDPEGL